MQNNMNKKYTFECGYFVVSQRKCIEIFRPKYEEVSFLDEVLDEINIFYESVVEALSLTSCLFIFLLPILFLFFL